jgi:hypothetical protein
MLARLARPTVALRPPVAFRGFAAIPVNSVARVVRAHVPDEATAIKCDALVDEVKVKLEASGLAGYSKTVRTVCKAEWGARPQHRARPPSLRLSHHSPIMVWRWRSIRDRGGVRGPR